MDGCKALKWLVLTWARTRLYWWTTLSSNTWTGCERLLYIPGIRHTLLEILEGVGRCLAWPRGLHSERPARDSTRPRTRHLAPEGGVRGARRGAGGDRCGREEGHHTDLSHSFTNTADMAFNNTVAVSAQKDWKLDFSAHRPRVDCRVTMYTCTLGQCVHLTVADRLYLYTILVGYLDMIRFCTQNSKKIGIAPFTQYLVSTSIRASESWT